MTGARWTHEMEDRLRMLIGQKWTLRQIAIEIGQGLTRSAVSGKADRLGLLKLRPGASVQRSRLTEEEVAARTVKAEARELRASQTNSKASGLAIVRTPDVAAILGLETPLRGCNWPVGHVGEPGFGWCGAGVEKGRWWCPEHWKRGHTTSMTDRKVTDYSKNRRV